MKTDPATISLPTSTWTGWLAWAAIYTVTSALPPQRPTPRRQTMPPSRLKSRRPSSPPRRATDRAITTSGLDRSSSTSRGGNSPPGRASSARQQPGPPAVLLLWRELLDGRWGRRNASGLAGWLALVSSRIIYFIITLLERDNDMTGHCPAMAGHGHTSLSAHRYRYEAALTAVKLSHVVGR